LTTSKHKFLYFKKKDLNRKKMQTCDICTKLQLTNYLIFSLSISILRMGASGPGHSTRGERGGPGQEAMQTSVTGRVRPSKRLWILWVQRGFLENLGPICL